MATTQAALGKLFMRIDANSDGTVDWDEFSSYMLLESQGSASIRDLETTISFDQPGTRAFGPGCLASYPVKQRSCVCSASHGQSWLCSTSTT